jgi:putative MATE family efflux protein
MMGKIAGTAEKKAAIRRDWTKGSIIGNILLLSWPMIVLGLAYTINLILELIWIGKLGPASIAAVGIGGFVVVLVIGIKSGLSVGERAMVSRLIGSGDSAGANHIVGQAFLLSIAYAAVVALAVNLLAQPLLTLFGLESAAVTEGVTYLRIILSAWVTEAIWITSFSAMQASGDTLTPMKVAIVIRVVNAAICPFLILGLWVFPRMGVTGAAITYIIAVGLGMSISLWVLFTGRTRLHLHMKDLYPDFKIIGRILRIGIPASAMSLGKSFCDLVITGFIVPFGTLALAAHNSIYRIESFINTPGLGFGGAGSVLIGQNLGAGQPGKAVRSGWLAAALAAGFMIICCVVLLVWAENIISLFNTDPDLVKLGGTFLRIAVIGYLGMSMVSIMQNCISGSGDTLPPMLITLSMLWVVQIPLALVLSRYTDLGVFGVRWAVAISFIVGAIALTSYFWSGRWKRKKV